MSPPLVIKVGGSLLATPGAMDRVAGWLNETRQEGQARLLIAGGGPAVEGLRTIDHANPLPQQASHEAAIEIMDANTRLLAEWLPAVRPCLLSRIEGPPFAGDQAVLVGQWLREVEPGLPGPRLQPGWHTTSDAIAARVAACLEASLLVLKHYSVNAYDNLKEAAVAGVVDSECVRIARGLTCTRVSGLPLDRPPED